jgi:hypothetical protein
LPDIRSGVLFFEHKCSWIQKTLGRGNLLKVARSVLLDLA